MDKVEQKLKVAEEILSNPGMNRRGLLARAGLVGAAALGAGLLGKSTPSADAALPATFGPKGHRIKVSDVDILNFALNLEYLEAEFYQRAAFGIPLPAALTGPGGAKGTGTTGTVTGGSQVPFASPAVREYAAGIAADEARHVATLRGALGKFAVAEPNIDVSDAVFNKAAVAAGINLPDGFSPYANDTTFLLGAFLFEDVGVTAYHGAAPYIRNPNYLAAAAGILAVEAYHAGLLRLLVFQAGAPYSDYANQISALRQAASAAADGVQITGEGVVYGDGSPNIVPTDANGLAFARSFAAVLNIVYLNTTATPVSGGFFPNGLNGRITRLA